MSLFKPASLRNKFKGRAELPVATNLQDVPQISAYPDISSSPRRPFTLDGPSTPGLTSSPSTFSVNSLSKLKNSFSVLRGRTRNNVPKTWGKAVENIPSTITHRDAVVADHVIRKLNTLSSPAKLLTPTKRFPPKIVVSAPKSPAEGAQKRLPLQTRTNVGPVTGLPRPVIRKPVRNGMVPTKAARKAPPPTPPPRPTSKVSTLSSSSSRELDALLDKYRHRTPEKRHSSPVKPLVKKTRKPIPTLDIAGKSKPKIERPPEAPKGHSLSRAPRINSIPSSRSLTPLQLIRSSGFIAANMLRDESMSALSSAVLVGEGLGEELMPKPDEPIPSEPSTSILLEEAAPFDMTSMDSYPALDVLRLRQGSISPTVSSDSVHKLGIEVTEEREVEAIIDHKATGDSSASSNGSLLGLETIEWPLPPERSLVVTGNVGEMAEESEIEHAVAEVVAEAAPDRVVITFKDGQGGKPTTTPAPTTTPSPPRTEKLIFTPSQLSSIAERPSLENLHETAPAPKTAIEPTAPAGVATKASVVGAAVEALIKDAVARVSSRRPALVKEVPQKDAKKAQIRKLNRNSIIKITECRIDADDLDGEVTKYLMLSSSWTPGQVNKIAMVASEVKGLVAFCAHNHQTTVSTVAADTGKEVVIEVKEVAMDDGTTQAMCLMYLDDAKLPVAPRGEFKLLAKFSINTPSTLSAIARRIQSKLDEAKRAKNVQVPSPKMGDLPPSVARRVSANLSIARRASRR